MKKVLFILGLSAALFSCKKENTTVEEIAGQEVSTLTEEQKEGIAFIKEFYKYECGEQEGGSESYYLDSRLNARRDSLNEGGDLTLDWDPYIQGQDSDPAEILSTLKVEALPGKDEYRATFKNFSTLSTVDYLVKKNKNEELKIMSVLSEPLLSFKTDIQKEYNFYDLAKVELNVDGANYKVVVLERKENKELTQHYNTPLVVYRDGKRLVSNIFMTDNQEENCEANGFISLVASTDGFIFKQSFCKGDLNVTRSTSFKIDDELQKVSVQGYEEEYTDTNKPDRVLPKIIKRERGWFDLTEYEFKKN
ncbi:MAG: hypothetical protein ACRCVU_07295 [Flavobacterium sp.]